MTDRQVKEVRVTLKQIRCSKVGSDAGPTLEIYGNLRALGVFVNGQGQFEAGFTGKLWDRADNNAVQMAETNQLFPNTQTTFIVFENDFLWVGGRLFEDDDLDADDDMGARDARILYRDIATKDVPVRFQESSQIVDVTFGIELLRTFALST
ncbi:hypothetical protein ACH4U5_39260 [Streptomyces sp. NPDC020858]|uniref:hypothetical protein n=1 Tax=Streptomyces sp. NPDC020858 TaxID=3365097 RepID=UPI00379C63CB